MIGTFFEKTLAVLDPNGSATTLEQRGQLVPLLVKLMTDSSSSQASGPIATDITPLLARLFVEAALDQLRAGKTLDDIPASIPELYFRYLDRLNPDLASSAITADDQRKAAVLLAGLATATDFVPRDFSRAAATSALSSAFPKEGSATALVTLMVRNGILQERKVGDEAFLRFVLDPLAECLGAYALKKKWDAVHMTFEQGTALPETQGMPDAFRRALGTVYRAYGRSHA